MKNNYRKGNWVQTLNDGIVKVICIDSEYIGIETKSGHKLLNRIEDVFGIEMNEKLFKLLNFIKLPKSGNYKGGSMICSINDKFHEIQNFYHTLSCKEYEINLWEENEK